MRKKFRMPKKLPFTIGFEFTGISHDWHSDVDVYASSQWRELISRIRLQLIRVPSPKRPGDPRYVHYDDGAVEVTNYPTRFVTQIKECYNQVEEVFKKNGIYPKHPDSVCGGGHIHIGSISPQVKYKMLTDMLRRPYLPWAFSEPDEADACDYPSTSINMFRALPDFKSGEMLKYRHWPKSWMFRLDPAYSTAEFRFFEAPLNWDEQLLHIKFVTAYYRWIKNRPLKGFDPRDGYTKKQLQKISFKEARSKFRAFLRQLGLDPKDYEHFVERNMKPRWQNGRKRR